MCVAAAGLTLPSSFSLLCPSPSLPFFSFPSPPLSVLPQRYGAPSAADTQGPEDKGQKGAFLSMFKAGSAEGGSRKGGKMNAAR